MIKVTVNQQTQEFPPETEAWKVFKEILGETCNITAAELEGRAVDLNTKLTADCALNPIEKSSLQGLEILRHSASHVMAQAVKRLFPEVKLAIGPAIENGFYYDFDLKTPFTPEDLEKVEAEMAKIIKENLPFSRKVVSKDDAREIFGPQNEVYKLELIADIPGETVSLYTCGEFTDLCAGPHLGSSGKIKAFKLLSVAGAYWRGKEENPQLQRIYGTAFPAKEELAAYLEMLAEAEKRDHRKLGKQLDLFSMHEDGGAGLIYWHPKAARIRRVIEEFWYKEHYKRGYEVVYTPHIAKDKVWKTSGHLDFYKENMYSPIDIEGQDYLLKPMNCPFHIMIYKTKLRSYRDLPIRLAEMGTVYRYERSGVLHGLLRVRGFTQDDAHIFCTPEQLGEEMIGAVELAQFMLKTFGFKEYQVFMATRPESHAGTSEDWDIAEATLEKALQEKAIPYEKDEGGAVFYGPKIDIKIKDSLGRFWQGPTIQFDFNLASRFQVTYRASDGKDHSVFMVHRAVLGSLERFMGMLIEHYAGAFPLWLSPVQAMIIPVTEVQNDYARKLQDQLRAEGFRVETDLRNEKMGLKIREAQLEKIPYMLVVGEREIESGVVAVRERKEGDIGKFTPEQLLALLKQRESEKI